MMLSPISTLPSTIAPSPAVHLKPRTDLLIVAPLILQPAEIKDIDTCDSLSSVSVKSAGGRGG